MALGRRFHCVPVKVIASLRSGNARTVANKTMGEESQRIVE